MKLPLLFFAIWNIAWALLRAFRMQLEELRFLRRLYTDRSAAALEQVGDLELSFGAKARYRAAAEEVRRLTGMRMPELLCSRRPGMSAGTRGWIRHQIQLSRGTLNHASEGELLAILAHEFGHIHYRHFAIVRIAELAAAAAYGCAVGWLWHTSFTWYTYLGIWSLLDFSFAMCRLAVGSATELMADHFAARKLGLANGLSRGLIRAQCFNSATEFTQITSFYPTVKLRLRLLSRYGRAAG